MSENADATEINIYTYNAKIPLNQVVLLENISVYSKLKVFKSTSGVDKLCDLSFVSHLPLLEKLHLLNCENIYDLSPLKKC